MNWIGGVISFMSGHILQTSSYFIIKLVFEIIAKDI